MNENIFSGIMYPTVSVPGTVNNFNDILTNLGINERGLVALVADSKKTYNEYRHNPFLMKDMDKFVARVNKAIDNNEIVCVFGDFDADGITATAVMKKGLEYLGLENVYYIAPNRDTGYSIQRAYIEEHFKDLDNKKLPHPTLIITVDCGIKSGVEVDFITQHYGVDIIITDHHLPPPLHDFAKTAVAIVDPHQEDCNYPFPHISGSFVALKCIEALLTTRKFVSGPAIADMGFGMIDQNVAQGELQDIAVIGTIADVMPILDENRLLARTALPRFATSANMAIRKWTAKIRSSSYSALDSVDTDIVGFGIGPRLNAANRIGSYTAPLQMLLAEDMRQIETFFNLTEQYNHERKLISGAEKKKALETIENIALYNNNILIHVDKNIPEGIIGLVASAIKEKFDRPSIVIGGYNPETRVYKGSCRSISNVHILDNLSLFEDYLLGYGGHAGAAGFSIKEEYLDAFVRDFTHYANQYVDVSNTGATCSTAGIITDFSIVNKTFLTTISLLGPFGHKNEKPQFMVTGTVVNVRIYGQRNNNIAIVMKDEKGNIIEGNVRDTQKTLGLFPDDIINMCPKGSVIGLVGILDIVSFNGQEKNIVIVKDIIPPSQDIVDYVRWKDPILVDNYGNRVG